MSYRGLVAETVKFKGHNGDEGEAYYARPSGSGKFPGVVLIHHMPGWDEWIMEATRKLAHHGFATISPHLYFREGPGSPDDVGARVRAAGGVADDQVVGDAKGAAAWIRARPEANGKVGVIGYCSGGRHAFLIACKAPEFDALVDCWGGNVVVDDSKALNATRPVAPIEFAANIKCPILGLFGNDDENPNADQVNRTEAVLKKLGKTTHSTATTPPDTPSSTPRARHTGLNRPPMAGLRSSPSTVSTSADRSPTGDRHVLLHRREGQTGWHSQGTKQPLDEGRHCQRLLRPSVRAQLDHALCVDFVCEADGGRERVAIEISRESALELMEKIKAAPATGDASHAKAAACSLVGTKTEMASLFRRPR